MVRLLLRAGRAVLAAVVFCLVLAALRWGPTHAEPPWDLRALPLYGVAVALAACLAVAKEGMVGRRPLRRWVWVAALAGWGAVVALRGPVGISAVVLDPRGVVGVLPPSAVDVAGPDLRALPAVRRWSVSWRGALRVPESGMYRLWAAGRGRVVVLLDGRRVLEGEGEALRAGRDLPLVRGESRLEVLLERTGPGPRLRLGWVRPDGTAETIPARHLGPAVPAVWWWLTDGLALLLAALLARVALSFPWSLPRPDRAGLATRTGEWVASALGLALLASILSWPMVTDPARLGVTDRPDGRLNAWILGWGVHALVREPGRLFQAPAFHPLPDALAFSENLLVPAVAAAPFVLASGPVLGYNVVLLLSFVVSGLGVYALARRVTDDRGAAFVGAAAFAVGAHRWIRLAHLHVQVTWFLPWALVAFDSFWRKRRLKHALLLGLLLGLQGLSSVYLGAVTAVAVAAAALAALLGGLRGRDLLKLGAGLALAAALVLPTARVYLRMRAHQDVEWGEEDVRRYATTLASYAASGTRLYGGITQRHLGHVETNDTLFPGLVLLVLGLAGLARAPRRFQVVALLAGAGAVVLSLGPETALYRVLHENVVLFRGVRALSRLSLVPVLVLCVGAGLFLAGRSRRAVWLALGLLLLESSNAPLRLFREPGPAGLARALAAGQGPVAVLPLGEDDTRVMLDGLVHGRPLLNGDSAFVPRPYARAMELLAGPLDAEAFSFLRATGVRQVASRQPLPLALAAEAEGWAVYDVPPEGPPAAPVVATPRIPAAVVWGGGAIRLDLGGTRPVQGLVFVVSDAPWVARPRVEASVDGGAWTRMDARASLAAAAVGLYANPGEGLGEVVFPTVDARFVRVSSDLPAVPGAIWARPSSERLFNDGS